MMNYGVVWIFLILFFIDIRNDVQAIDDKLDFGDNHPPHHSSFVNDHTIHRNSFIPTQHSTVRQLQSNDAFDNIGIVCTDGGCNTTKSASDSDNSVKTEVLVHVQTTVDLKHNNSHENNTPDIPIVVGTDESNPNRNDYDRYNNQRKDIFIPGNEPKFYPNSGSVLNDKPYGSSYPNYIPKNLFYPSRNIDSSNPFQDFDSGVNINIKTLPPVTLDIADPSKNMLTTNYNAKGVELTVPYIDPSLRTHNYGERDPFYSRRTNVMTPVDFKFMRPSWRPSSWQNQFATHRHGGVLPIPTGKECACPNGQVGTEINWYPNSNRRNSVPYVGQRSYNNDPGSQIDDKLAPLN